MGEALLVVDVQVGFINNYTRHVPERVARLIATGAYDPVLFTRFVNVPESPYHRLLDWHACSTEPEIALAPEVAPLASADRTFDKAGYAGLPSAVATYVQEHGIERLTIVGIDTDMCVLKTAHDLFDRRIEPIVLVDCCASTAGLQAHLAGLAILSRNIGPRQLRDAGIGDGLMAAPSA